MRRMLTVIALVVAALAMTAGVSLADFPHQDAKVLQANGGGINSDNGEVMWYVPPYAYTFGDLRLRYTQYSMADFPSPSSTSIWAADPFGLQLQDYDTGALVNLSSPSTITVHYDPSTLGGRSESTLRVVMLPLNAIDWVNLPSTVDTTNHTVTAQVTTSADYGLFVSNAPPTAAPPSAPAPTAAPAPAPAPVPAPAPTAAPAPAPAPAATTSSVISGQVFFDKNGNGVMDDGDFPVAGAGVLITSGYWSSFTRTGPDGHYSFPGLGNGTYQVNVIVGPEWAFTTPFAVPGIAVSGQPGSNGTANFGMWYKLP